MEQSNNVMSNGYGIMPKTILYDPSVSSSAKLLYIEISSLCAEKGYCWASNTYLAKKFQTTTISISRWLSELEKYINFDNRQSKRRRIYIKGEIDNRTNNDLIKNDKVNLIKNDKHNIISINTTNNHINNIQNILPITTSTGNTTNTGSTGSECSRESDVMLSASQYLECFNSVFGRKFSNVNMIAKNLSFWLSVYDIDQICKAVKRAKLDRWFGDKATPELLLRTRNKNGDCDYIGQLLNRPRPDYASQNVFTEDEFEDYRDGEY